MSAFPGTRTERLNKTSLFGVGFVLGEYAKTYPDEVVCIPRNDIIAPTNNILYGISTIHNYHPKDGDPHIDIQTNLVHFMNVLDANINEESVFNLISTWFVYGKTQIPAQEDSPCNPTGFYSITARAREQLLISYCETFGLKYRILMLCNVIGIGDQKASPKKNALQWMTRELAQGRNLRVYNNNPVRDYMDVRDCVRAIHLILEKGKLNEIYNVSNGQGESVRGLVEHAAEFSAHKGNVGSMNVPEFHSTVQTGSIYLDNSKLRALGYVQQHDIRTTIGELVKYYEQNEN